MLMAAATHPGPAALSPRGLGRVLRTPCLDGEPGNAEELGNTFARIRVALHSDRNPHCRNWLYFRSKLT